MVVAHTKEEILSWLSAIEDPEIPVVSIVDMGMIRDVLEVDGRYVILFTPTYMGCPAVQQIKDDMHNVMKLHGITDAEIRLVYSPAWTTDWMTEDTRERLRNYGIAPPKAVSCGSIHNVAQSIACPRCGSDSTELISKFGSTACKALYKCRDCREPFEYFKCI